MLKYTGADRGFKVRGGGKKQAQLFVLVHVIQFFVNCYALKGSLIGNKIFVLYCTCTCTLYI
jgi:hypothetical protein